MNHPAPATAGHTPVGGPSPWGVEWGSASAGARPRSPTKAHAMPSPLRAPHAQSPWGALRPLLCAGGLVLWLGGCATLPDDIESNRPYQDSSLSAYGNWGTAPDGSTVWYPYDAGPGWAPYQQGRWTYAGSTWVWVDQAPWGWATSRPGQWAQVGGRWGWLPQSPGRPPAGPGRPAFPPPGGGLPGGWPPRSGEPSAPPVQAPVRPPWNGSPPPVGRPGERNPPPASGRDEPRMHIPHPVLRDAPPSAPLAQPQPGAITPPAARLERDGPRPLPIRPTPPPAPAPVPQSGAPPTPQSAAPPTPRAAGSEDGRRFPRSAQ
jgi:hypothetical protein